MAEILFVIEGDPVAKSRPRFSTQGGYARAYTPAKTKNWETMVKLIAKKKIKLLNWKMTLKPVEVSIWVYRTLPKVFKGIETLENGKKRVCDKRPDADNYAKGILDAFNGIVYKDDGQVILLKVYKHYANQPRTIIEVKEW